MGNTKNMNNYKFQREVVPNENLLILHTDFNLVPHRESIMRGVQTIEGIPDEAYGEGILSDFLDEGQKKVYNLQIEKAPLFDAGGIIFELESILEDLLPEGSTLERLPDLEAEEKKSNSPYSHFEELRVTGFSDLISTLFNESDSYMGDQRSAPPQTDEDAPDVDWINDLKLQVQAEILEEGE